MAKNNEGHDVVIDGEKADPVTSSLVTQLLEQKGRLNRVESVLDDLSERLNDLEEANPVPASAEMLEQIRQAGPSLLMATEVIERCKELFHQATYYGPINRHTVECLAVEIVRLVEKFVGFEPIEFYHKAGYALKVGEIR